MGNPREPARPGPADSRRSEAGRDALSPLPGDRSTTRLRRRRKGIRSGRAPARPAHPGNAGTSPLGARHRAHLAAYAFGNALYAAIRLHTAPNWKFCEFKHGHPRVIFGAPESAALCVSVGWAAKSAVPGNEACPLVVGECWRRPCQFRGLRLGPDPGQGGTYRGGRVGVPAGGPVLFGRDEVDGEDLEGDVAEGEGGEVPCDGDAVPGRQWCG